MSRYVIQCFPWEQAPAELQALDATAADGDWIVVMPVSLLTTYHSHPLLDRCLDGSRVNQYEHPTDPHYSVFIGTQETGCTPERA